MFIATGYLIPIVFWLTTLICGWLWDDYDHLRNMVSELGTLGSETQYIFSAGLVLSALLSIPFIIGLLHSCKKKNINRIPIIIMLTYSFSILGAGLFPYPLHWHGILGAPSVVLFLSPFLALILWKEKVFPNFKKLAIASFLLFMMGFLVFSPDILSEYFGLKQLFFHMGWSLWFFGLSYGFRTDSGS